MYSKQPVFPNWNPALVKIGDLVVGGGHPVLIQSMTNTPTLDTSATVAQCKRLYEVGCDMIRITAQNTREAENLAVIKSELRRTGINTPLIADVHFHPAVAEKAAGLVEKVRINPGNYINKRLIRNRYSDAAYNAELGRIAEKLQPLLDICRNFGTAIRIGTNHGSLSGRIMQRYGNTPAGMAESAMEFVRICHAAGFHQLVLSMKSSNVRVMVAATRLLVQKMIAEQMQYPVHLGVTEAGNGLEGRLKSAAGTGTLLADGIGDTIRVSLTEAPENEIPVAKEIVAFYQQVKTQSIGPESPAFSPAGKPDVEYRRRKTHLVGKIGGDNLPVVLWGQAEMHTINEDLATEGNTGKMVTMESYYFNHQEISYLQIDPIKEHVFSLLKIPELNKGNIIPVFILTGMSSVHKTREIIKIADENYLTWPVLLSYAEEDPDINRFAVHAAMRLAPFLIDGLCDGIYLKNSRINDQDLARIAFGVLQATRSRITQTEYIACPGCGRTQYDLEAALEKVRQATSHLKGLKIAVMGCIVNGPGEMADADFGYVGQGNGKLSLYKGRTLMKKNIAEVDAVHELMELIRAGDHVKYL